MTVCYIICKVILTTVCLCVCQVQTGLTNLKLVRWFSICYRVQFNKYFFSIWYAVIICNVFSHLICSDIRTIFAAVFVDFAVDQYYFSSDVGGELSAGSQCAPGCRLDYLWVIPRTSLIDDTYTLLLKLEKIRLSSMMIILIPIISKQ